MVLWGGSFGAGVLEDGTVGASAPIDGVVEVADEDHAERQESGE
jgi:hypothetical protein